EAALADPKLPAVDRARAHGLAALIHSAFDRPTEAIAAYEQALEADSTFEVKDASPKVRALFDEAKKNHARKTRPPPAWVQSPPPAPAPSTPWVKSPWVWAVAGVVVAGAAVTTTVLVLEARMPVGNLPNGQLR
ncbi:MAG: hypothetical protein JNK82_13380, partial [Myxococcaceae bacterium]|nr:hypothetical protein [Myxococcaceae bacterium]